MGMNGDGVIMIFIRRIIVYNYQDGTKIIEKKFL